MRRVGDVFGRRGGHRQLKEHIIIKRTFVAFIVLLICAISLFFTFNGTNPSSFGTEIGMDELWGTGASGGWSPSSAPRADWPPPPNESNGYLRVRCYGGLIQQRATICNAVLAARIMNATLVLPELDAESFSHVSKPSGFQDIYDVEHFIKSLRYDVRIVKSLPEIHTHGKMKKMKAYKIDPPTNAPVNWYTTVALEKMKEHGAIYLEHGPIYLTQLSHRLENEIKNHEYQRLRCRVNYDALRFKPQLMKLSNMIVSKLRSQGHFLAIHFELDMMGFDVFTPEQQQLQKMFQSSYFMVVDPSDCPLKPEEVGLILRAMGFDNSTRIYLADAEFYDGERYMKPFRALFPHLENHNTVVPANEELTENNTLGLLGSAVDYMVCLQADIFMPTHNGPSTFATNVIDHRLYYGFRTTIQPDRKALARIFTNRERETFELFFAEKKKNKEDYAAAEAAEAAEAAAGVDFEEAVRRVMFKTNKFGGPHEWGRVRREIFKKNPWPDCFCQISAAKNSSSADNCPPLQNSNTN